MSDNELLNGWLSGEYFATAAYEGAIQSGLLDEGTIAVARQFQADHEEHVRLVLEQIKRLGGEPVERKSLGEYAESFPPLNSAGDILAYATKLERQAAAADVKAVAQFEDKSLATLAAQVATVEAMHFAALRGAEGENPVPESLLSLEDPVEDY